MQSHINSLVLVILAVLVSVGFAEEAMGSPEKSALAVETKDVSVPSFPYVAEMTADNVNIRSGPGTNYYSCGKLNKADRIKVVGSKHSWSHIVPPAGSFSWISIQYVSVDPDDSTVGIVTGEPVRVYAGSARVKPIHSTTVQVKLNKGDKVKLLGEQKGDYYKIAPPVGAYLWVSTKYTRPLGPVGEVPLTVVAPAAETEEEKVEVVVPTNLSVETKKLKRYYALQKRIEAERAKPILQQDYTDIKKALLEIAGDREAGRATRYSKFTIKQIERFELAFEVAKAVELQDKQLQQVKERIDKARAARLATVEDLGVFAAIGQFQTSNIYGAGIGPKHYRIIEDTGRTVCYALPSESASGVDLSQFVGRKVGLIGTIQPYPQISGALVRFTKVVELQ